MTLTESSSELNPNEMEDMSNEDIAVEFYKCKNDIKYFAENYVYINDPQTYQTFKFEPWTFQLNLFDFWNDYDKSIILKGRQLGISWCASIYTLHRIFFFDNANVLMISKREDEAQSLIKKVKFIYDRLPDWMRDQRPVAGRDGGNKKELVLEKRVKGEILHYGKATALPATKDAGRSETASIVIADEWAFHKYAEDNWTAISPTIDSGGKFIGISTANGLGNFYYKQWQGAERGNNGFTSLFLAYDLRPGRDLTWYNEKKATYPDEKLFHQEYPRSPQEAFITTGGCIFDLEGLQFLSENLCEEPLTPLQVREKNEALGQLINKWPANLKVWGVPKLGHTYVIGADPAGGDAGGDFSAAYVIDSQTTEVVASIHGRIDPDTFSGLLVTVAEIYDYALLVVERNNHGYAVHNSIRNQYNYGHVFKFRKDRTNEGDNKEGMITNSKTKPIMETNLQVRIKERSLQIHDIDFIFEAQTYVRENGRTGAEGDAFDDRVSAIMLGLMGIEVGQTNRARRLGRKVNMGTSRGHFRTRHR